MESLGQHLYCALSLSVGTRSEMWKDCPKYTADTEAVALLPQGTACGRASLQVLLLEVVSGNTRPQGWLLIFARGLFCNTGMTELHLPSQLGSEYRSHCSHSTDD